MQVINFHISSLWVTWDPSIIAYSCLSCCTANWFDSFSLNLFLNIVLCLFQFIISPCEDGVDPQAGYYDVEVPPPEHCSLLNSIHCFPLWRWSGPTGCILCSWGASSWTLFSAYLHPSFFPLKVEWTHRLNTMQLRCLVNNYYLFFFMYIYVSYFFFTIVLLYMMINPIAHITIHNIMLAAPSKNYITLH